TGANAEPAHHHPAPRLGNGDRHKPARESAPRLLQGRRAELCSVGFGSRHRDYRESPAPERAADPAGVQQGAGVRGRDIPKAARHGAARRRQAPRQPLRRRILLSDAHGRRGGDRMTAETKHRRREKGIALVYVGVFLVPLLICTGLAVDLGRGYLVRVALAKAVDATALAVARNISKADSGLGIANNIFSANFPPNFLGVTPSPQPNIDIKVDDADGSYVINVKSTATVQTTFMRLAKFDTLAVGVGAVARRRLVDMSFVIDRSASLGSAFPQVQEAAIDFVRDGFTQDDRIALITFSGGTKVEDPMTAERGFDEDKIISDIRGASPSGPTATAEALYQAWDQLRGVPPDSQNSLRIVVLFTDGTPNAFPGNFMVSASKTAGTCDPALVPAPRTIVAVDYPYRGPGTGTRDDPFTIGLYQTDADTELAVKPTNIDYQGAGNSSYRSQPDSSANHDTQLDQCIPHLPDVTLHGFPLIVDNLGGQRPLF